jgi:hypothetical protein
MLQQQRDRVVILDQDNEVVMGDVHAPAKTYYTTGNNSGDVINRLRTLSVGSVYSYFMKRVLTNLIVIRVDMKFPKCLIAHFLQEKEEHLMVSIVMNGNKNKQTKNLTHIL